MSRQRALYVTGDVRDVLAKIPDGSIDLVLSSPPFLALRSYLPADHPDKAREIGSEATPGAFLDVMLDLTEEWGRMLAPHGSLAIELGDTYAGSGGAGGDYGDGGMRDGQPAFKGSGVRSRSGGHRLGARAEADSGSPKGAAGWPNDKSLTLIPELYRVALAYGRNPLTGRETPRWRVRNVVRWARPNPPVGALGDKFRPATSDMVIACGTDEAGRTRWFDLDAVRVPASPSTNPRTAEGVDVRPNSGKAADDERRGGNWSSLGVQHSTSSAPPLDWWDALAEALGEGIAGHTDDGPALERHLARHLRDTGVIDLDDTWQIPTQPYKGSHYATWPERLCTRPILAMCPLRVCTVCGEPSRRLTEVGYEAHGQRHEESKGVRGGAGASGEHAQHMEHGRATKVVTTVGWTDCGHDSWRPGRVLDPFAGSGTLRVAFAHGRDGIGIDLDERNVELAAQRVGPLFLEHVGADVLATHLGGSKGVAA